MLTFALTGQKLIGQFFFCIAFFLQSKSRCKANWCQPILMWLRSKDKKLLRLYENGNENLFLRFTPPTCLLWEALIFNLSAPPSHLPTWPCRLTVGVSDKQTSSVQLHNIIFMRILMKQTKREHDVALRMWTLPPPSLPTFARDEFWATWA